MKKDKIKVNDFEQIEIDNRDKIWKNNELNNILHSYTKPRTNLACLELQPLTRLVNFCEFTSYITDEKLLNGAIDYIKKETLLKDTDYKFEALLNRFENTYSEKDWIIIKAIFYSLEARFQIFIANYNPANYEQLFTYFELKDRVIYHNFNYVKNVVLRNFDVDFKEKIKTLSIKDGNKVYDERIESLMDLDYKHGTNISSKTIKYLEKSKENFAELKKSNSLQVKETFQNFNLIKKMSIRDFHQPIVMSVKEYELIYESRLSNHLKIHIDYDTSHFISDEKNNYEFYFNLINSINCVPDDLLNEKNKFPIINIDDFDYGNLYFKEGTVDDFFYKTEENEKGHFVIEEVRPDVVNVINLFKNLTFDEVIFNSHNLKNSIRLILKFLKKKRKENKLNEQADLIFKIELPQQTNTIKTEIETKSIHTNDTYYNILENCTIEAFESLKLKELYPNGTKAIWNVSSLKITKGDGLPTDDDNNLFRKEYIKDDMRVTFLMALDRNWKDFENKHAITRTFFYKKCYQSLLSKISQSPLWNKPDFGFDINAEPCSLTFIWNMRTDIEERSKEYQQPELPQKLDNKPKKPKKNLSEFIHNIEDKEAFLQDLKNMFPTEIGKAIKGIIDLLKKDKYLIHNDREFSDVVNAIRVFFNRDIGSVQGIRDAKNTDDKVFVEPIEQKLNPLINKHKTS